MSDETHPPQLKDWFDEARFRAIGRELAAYALQEGVLLRPLGNVAYCLPPYCITDAELDLVYGVMHRFLSGARAETLTTGGPVDD